MDIFISYRRDGAESLAQLLYTRLKADGYDVFLDVESLRSGDFNEALYEQIDQCSDFLLLLPPHGLDRCADPNDWVRLEVERAIQRKKNIIPVMMRNFEFPDVLPGSLSQLRNYNGVPAIMDLGFDAVIHKLKKMLVSVPCVDGDNVIQSSLNKERDEFWRITQSREYKSFVQRVMAKYYGENHLVQINGRIFPVFIVKGQSQQQVKSIKDFDCLCDLEGSRISGFYVEDHQEYFKNKWFAEYSHILEGKIKHPDRPGYMLDELLLNAENEIDKIRVHVGTYAENVYSSHVLEYELFRCFLKFGGRDITDDQVWTELLPMLEMRNRIHHTENIGSGPFCGAEMNQSLLRGDNRDSLLSVQMLVIAKSKRTHKYEVKIAQRSDQVAVAPGIYQFVPAGGFEILNDSDDDQYDDLELEENFSPGCAVFREFLEEVFNLPEFEGGGTGSIEERLLKEPEIIQIEQLLQSGKASLQFLGSALDLVGLRHELSFCLVVHEEEYSDLRFLGNEECKKGMIHPVPIDSFEKKLSIWDNMHTSSAAMWKMFTQTDLYRQISETENN